ncbi:MAG: hypothetical protein AAF184_23090 [Pseudomonadota bacterium]
MNVSTRRAERAVVIVTLLCLGSTALASDFPAVFELGRLPAGDGSEGVNLASRSPGAAKALSGVGDINGDGIDDFAVGAPAASGQATASGAAIVVFGRADTPYPAILNIDDLFEFNGGDGSDGFTVRGSFVTAENTGVSVSAAGDVNGDGIDDLLIGARLRAWVLYGRDGPGGDRFEADVQLSNIPFDSEATRGFELAGAGVSGAQGVIGPADVNGDGIDDIIVSNPDAAVDGETGVGRVYVLYGRDDGDSTPFPSSVDLEQLPEGDGSEGFVITGIKPRDGIGEALGVGDFNGDGRVDLLIGAPFANVNQVVQAGQAYLVYGRPVNDPFPAVFSLRTLQEAFGGDGSEGLIINGRIERGNAGFSLASAGDVNDDGMDDVLLGSFLTDTTGEAYLLYGCSSACAGIPALDLVELFPGAGGDGSRGAVLIGIRLGDLTGSAVSGPGDVNGDGIDDLLIGAERAGPGGRNGAGRVYLVFGRQGPAPYPPLFLLASLTPGLGGDGSSGVVFNGISGGAGSTLGNAGDVNGDGREDFMIGAEFAPVLSKAFVVFGRTPDPDAPRSD